MKELYRNWFLASRPWSFTMTAISVGVGGAIAGIDGPFSCLLFMATLLGAIFLHAATNLINDYYDVKGGVDTPDVSTAKYRPHPLVEGKLQPEDVRRTAYILFSAGAGIGLWLTFVSGWPLLIIGAIGIVAGLTYTAPPLSYKYVALGELSVFVMWGPLMVSGAYFVQRQGFSLDALLVSIPFGTLVALVILANNLRDISEDSGRDIRTLAILLGRERGFWLYAGLMTLAYGSILLLIVLSFLSIWSLLVFLSLPVAVKLLRIMAKSIPDDADARTAQLNTVFGALLLTSLLLRALL